MRSKAQIGFVLKRAEARVSKTALQPVWRPLPDEVRTTRMVSLGRNCAVYGAKRATSKGPRQSQVALAPRL